MNKDRPPTLYEKQKAERPSVLKVASENLNAELYRQLACFIEYLEQNKMVPRLFTTNSFQVTYKGKPVLRISVSYIAHIIKNSYAISIYTADEKYLEEFLKPLSDDMKEFYFNNIRQCQNCHIEPCVSKRMIILGKEIKNYCNTGMYIYEPTKQQYEYIKKFIMLRKEHIKIKENKS